MLVPSTPTSASGAFWKGNELGGDPPAQPTAPSTTSEVVKSKSGQPPRPAWGWGAVVGVRILVPPLKPSRNTLAPEPLLWNEGAPAPNSGLGKEQGWWKRGREEP